MTARSCGSTGFISDRPLRKRAGVFGGETACGDETASWRNIFSSSIERARDPGHRVDDAVLARAGNRAEHSYRIVLAVAQPAPDVFARGPLGKAELHQARHALAP